MLAEPTIVLFLRSVTVSHSIVSVLLVSCQVPVLRPRSVPLARPKKKGSDKKGKGKEREGESEGERERGRKREQERQ